MPQTDQAISKPLPHITHWSVDVHALFKEHRISMVSFVPDGGLKELIILCKDDPAIRSVTLTTEEEGIAFSAGAFLGGLSLPWVM